MDFLDPKKQRAHTIRLFVGYVLIGIGILIATVILLYTAYGFGLGKNGQVIQSGLVFFSSQPSPANIYINGQLNKAKTNSRIGLPAGEYSIKIERSGYRPWLRGITVDGGSVEHYDYPFLFPVDLVTKSSQNFSAAPPLATQSPDRRWLLFGEPTAITNFDLYDLNNPKTAMASVALPEGLLTTASGNQTWQLVEWSTDNQHVLLQHVYPGSSEYIVLNTQDPTKSVNVTKQLSLTADQSVSLHNKKFDQYYVYNSSTKQLATAAAGDSAITPYLEHVLSFKSYGGNIVMYATDQSAPAGKVAVMLRQGSDSFHLRDISASGPFLLQLAQYSGDWYMAAGAGSDSRVYIYKNPQGALQNKPKQPLVPIYTLRTANPTYLSFSDNARFIVSENANAFSVFDAETVRGYKYNVAQPLDAPQQHANWMDGHRLDYVSGGKVVVFDFDSVNLQTLMPGLPSYTPFFDRNYKFVYALAPTGNAQADAAGQVRLTSTSLLTPQDQ